MLFINFSLNFNCFNICRHLRHLYMLYIVTLRPSSTKYIIRPLISTQLFPVAFKIPSHLAKAVAAELLAHRLRDYESNHCFADDASRRDRSDVRALERGRLFLLRVYVNRAQSASQSRDRLE